MSKQPPSWRARFVRKLRRWHDVVGWRRIANHLVAPDRRQEFEITNDGLAFRGNLESFVDREIYLFGGYEQPLINQFVDLIPAERRGTIVDAGANVGTHTLVFARSFKRVIAFEPNPQVFKQLASNVGANQRSNVELHNLGLADRDHVLDFHMIDKPNLGLGTFSVEEQYDEKLRIVGRGTVVRGDRILAELGADRLDALKIDVQGFEPEVLTGLRDHLLRDHPFVWFEVGSATRARMGTRAAIEQLIPFRFKLLKFESSRRGLRHRVGLSDMPGSRIENGDYVAVPIEKATT